MRRWWVVATLFLLSFITIVDRVAISAAKPDMARDLSIPDVTFGLVFGAFALGYGVFMFPSGWLGDRLGPRRFLTLIVACWSMFTLWTGLVSTIPVLIAVRLLFGAAEAGAYPTAARAIYNWLEKRERGLALGLLNTGSRLGAAFGLAVMSLSVAKFGWRASFVALGIAGFLWAGLWYLWFRDRPRDARAQPVRDAGDWRALVSPNSGLILAQYFASNFTFFICFTWLLPYVKSQYGLSPAEAGMYSSVPLYFGALATWTSGLTVDFIFKRGRPGLSRRLPAMFGFSLASVAVVASAYMTTPASFILCFALTTFGVDFTLSPSWTVCSDVAGRYTATLSGAMNTMGSIGSFASSVTFPWLLALTGSVKTYFFAAACLNVLAVWWWWRIKPEPAGVELPDSAISKGTVR